MKDTAPPAALCRSACRQRNCQVVNYKIDPRDVTHRSGSSTEVSTEQTEGGEVKPAAVVGVPASGLAHMRGAGRSCAPVANPALAPEASAPASRGSRVARPDFLRGPTYLLWTPSARPLQRVSCYVVTWWSAWYGRVSWFLASATARDGSWIPQSPVVPLITRRTYASCVLSATRAAYW